MSNRGKPAVYQRDGSAFLWLRYYDEEDRLVRKSARTADPVIAERMLEECLAEVAAKRDLLEGVRYLTVGICFSASQEVGSMTEREERALTKTLDLQNRHAAREFAESAKDQVLKFIASRKSRLRATPHAGTKDGELAQATDGLGGTSTDYEKRDDSGMSA